MQTTRSAEEIQTKRGVGYPNPNAAEIGTALRGLPELVKNGSLSKRASLLRDDFMCPSFLCLTVNQQHKPFSEPTGVRLVRMCRLGVTLTSQIVAFVRLV